MSFTSFITEYNKRKIKNKYSGSISNLIFYGSIGNMIRQEQNRENRKRAEKDRENRIR